MLPSSSGALSRLVALVVRELVMKRVASGEFPLSVQIGRHRNSRVKCGCSRYRSPSSSGQYPLVPTCTAPDSAS